MEIEKSCSTCKLAKTAWPNPHCNECMIHKLKHWEPNEETVRAYVLKCQPGEASVTYDVVSKPKHYMLFDETEIAQRSADDKGVEVRDVIEKLVNKFGNRGFEVNFPLGKPLFESDYVQLMQYLMRFMDKNGVEDLKKARWYLDKMIESY